MGSVESPGPAISDEARGWIGRSFDLESAVITESDIRKFVIGSDDRNAIYTSVEIAKAQGHPSIPVPPMYYLAAIRPLVWRDELSPDGGLPDRRVPVGDGRVMAGEYEIEFLSPIRVGDHLRGRRTLDSLSPKQGSRRAFVIAQWTSEISNQRGELVVRERTSQLLF